MGGKLSRAAQMKLNKTKVAVAADASEDVVAASAQKKAGTNDEEKGNHESKAEDIPAVKGRIGFMCDDTLTSILPALPEFRDHHIIAINPPGWNGSTLNNPVESHASNADIIMEFLQVLGVAQTMVMGFSTGGGIAFYMAQRHPEKIKAAFLTHSIPISGLRYVTVTGELVPLKDLDQVRASTMFPTDDPDMVYDLFKSMSSNQEGFVPKNHKLAEYMIKAAQNMPVQSCCIIHGSEAEDFIVPWQIVEPVTKLAIIEQWAPLGMLSLYDDASGHTSLIDKPRALASVYRRALEEQILSASEEKI
ncbi:hypothetical protein ACHAWT_002438 [Skeletonema menzelii]